MVWDFHFRSYVSPPSLIEYWWEGLQLMPQSSLSIDCGKKPGVSAMDGVRRCRVLINHRAHLSLDLRLLSQVEVCLSFTEQYERSLG